MKKMKSMNRITLLITSGAIALALCICLGGAYMVKAVATRSADKENAEESYKKIYSELVEELSTSGQADMFALVNVDDDDIPELAAVSSEGSWDKEQVFLYTTDGKEAVLLADDIAPGMEGHYIAFFEKENVFIQSGGAMGERFIFSRIEDSKPVEITSAERFWLPDENDDEVVSCMVGDKEVSEKEFKETVEKNMPAKEMIKLAEVDTPDMVKYEVSFEDDYMGLNEIEKIPYSTYDEIVEHLSSNN